MAKRKGPGSYKPRRNFLHWARQCAGTVYEPNGKQKRGRYTPRMIAGVRLALFTKPRKRA